jgi:hypothetical protein
MWNENINNLANKTLARIVVLYSFLGQYSNAAPVFKLQVYVTYLNQSSLMVSKLGLIHTNPKSKYFKLFKTDD